MKKQILLSFYILFTVIAVCAQDAKIRQNSNSTGLNTIFPVKDSTTVLHNPAMGFTTYVTTWGVEQFGWASEAFGYAGVKENCNIVYLRCKWSDLEPREGDYVWKNNQSFKDLINGVKLNNSRIAFRVMVQEGRDATPNYVLDAIRANGQNPFFTVGNKYPDVTNPIWKQKFQIFMTAFGAAFDDPSIVDYVDANGLGLSGEGNLSGIPENIQEAHYDWHLGVYNAAFKKVLLNVTFAMFWPTPLDIDERLSFQKYNMLMRRDGMGSAWIGDSEITFMQSHFPATTLIGENCSSFGDAPGTGWWLDSKIIALANQLNEPISLRTHMKLIIKQSIDMHANTMTYQFRESKDWLANPDLLAIAIANLGYRLRPVKIDLPTQINTNAMLKINHVWTNDGVGVLPNTNRRWNNKYAIAFAFFKSGDTTPTKVFIDRNTEPGLLVKSTNTLFETNIQCDLPEGTYQLAVGIIDQTRPNDSSLDLAIKYLVRKNGWYIVGDVKVNQVANQLEKVAFDKCYNIGVINSNSNSNGGIVGLLTHTCAISDCFFLDTSVTGYNGIGTSKTSAELKNAALVATLNGTSGSLVWKVGANLNNGYPVFSWQSSMITDISNNLITVANVYLNQMQNELTINGAKGLTIKVVNLLGKVILSSKIVDNSQQFSLDILSSGCYIVLLESPGVKVTKKVMKY